GVLLGLIASGLVGTVPLGLGRSLLVWLPAAFLVMAFLPLVNGADQAIWQSKVAPDVQGKVFAARQVIAQVAVPLSALSAGPLADRVLEPGVAVRGPLAGPWGWLVGTGPGAGMRVMVLVSGLAMVALGV